MKNVLFCLLLIVLCVSNLFPENDSTDSLPFDAVLVISPQEVEKMDWWKEVPARFPPLVDRVKEVCVGEYFNLYLVLSRYGKSERGEVDVVWGLKVLDPDQKVLHQHENLEGFKGIKKEYALIPTAMKLRMCFDPENVLGVYTIQAKAYDRITGEMFEKTATIELIEFSSPTHEDYSGDWLVKYPVSPRPRTALSAYLESSASLFGKSGRPNMSFLWFSKLIYENNEFLLPHTVKFYHDKATHSQKKKILFLFHLLGKEDQLDVSGKLKRYLKKIRKFRVLDPYEEVVSGEQLDMLWAEFFVTSHLGPVRQLVRALNLVEYAGTLDQVNSGELDRKDKEVSRAAMKNAIFDSAMWSIESNCYQSPLLLHYCIGLYESDKLNPTERELLGVILKHVFERKKQESGSVKERK